MKTAQDEAKTYSVQGIASLTYTKARNYLFDVIIPEVTKFSPVAGLILFLIERETIGFHRDTVRLSIDDMMNFTNASESSVRRARNYLISEGYLEVIENGTGLNKTLLRFNLFPDGNPLETPPDTEIIPPPPASVKADKVIEPPDPPPHANSEDQQTPQDPPPMENMTDHVSGDEGTDPPLSSQTEHETASLSPMTSGDQPSSNQRSEVDPIPSESPPESPPENADPTAENQEQSNEKPEKSRAVTQTSPPERPPLAQDPNKTNSGPPEKSSDGDLAKKTVGFVLCFLRSLGAELEQRDFAFVWWAVKTYGIAAIEKQISVMRQQAKRGSKFINPIGRLRSGLTSSYEYCKKDRDYQKAKESRERQRQREEEQSRQYKAELEETVKENTQAVMNARNAELTAFIAGL